MKRISPSKGETLFVAGVILIAIFMAKFPTIYNWLNTPAGFISSKNTSWFDAWDTNFQVADIRWGQRQGFLAQNTYTTIPHKSELIYQFYTFLGVTNRLFHLDPYVMFHVGSVISSIILLLVCFWVIGVFVKDRLIQYCSFIIVSIGGGFGWLGKIYSSADATVAGFTMTNALERGSDAISTALLLATFTLLYLYSRTEKQKYIWYGLITSLFSITLHPPFAAMYVFLGIILSIYQWHRKKTMGIIHFPVIHFISFGLYYWLVLASLLDNPGFAGVIGQELFYLDSLRIILGFGLLSIFISVGLFFLKKTDEEFLFLKLFFILQLIFVFLPFGFRLYYVKGLFVWGVLLGLLTVAYVIRDPWRLRMLIALVFLSLFTRVYIFDILVHPSINNQFFYLRDDEGKALEYMNKLATDTNMLSLYRIGNFIPAITDNRVYFGHNFQTPGAKAKKALATKFYTTMSADERNNFLEENRIDYIYYGLEEKAIRDNDGLKLDEPFKLGFPLVFQEGDIYIYKVTDAAGKN